MATGPQLGPRPAGDTPFQRSSGCQLEGSLGLNFKSTITLSRNGPLSDFKEGSHYGRNPPRSHDCTAPHPRAATPSFINTSPGQAELMRVNFIVFRGCLTVVRNYLYHFIARAESNQNNYLKTEVYKF